MDEDEQHDAKPSSNRIFDRTISVTTLAVLVGMIAGSILWIFNAYLENQRQIYALQTQDVKFTADVNAIQRELALLKQVIVDLRGDQKETDNAIRKTLDAVLEDLRKNREDMYRMFGDRSSPRRPGGLSAPCYSNGNNCRPNTGLRFEPWFTKPIGAAQDPATSDGSF